jgi:murein DD-endopeptidase MepM/ murein hydrolase activator NlpD
VNTPEAIVQERQRLLTAQQRQLVAAAARLLGSYEPPLEQGYIWPLREPGRLSSYYGWRSLFGTSFHAGVDIALPTGNAIIAVRSGRVSRAGWIGAYGNAVFLDHGDGSQTRYAHMSQLLVAPGQTVAQGEVLGLVGSTGVSTGPHLHFELRFSGRSVDPLGYLPQP